MPIQGYTPNRSLVKISQNSTDNWDVWLNQNLDALDEPVFAYNSAAAQNLSAASVAVIKDDGTGAKKAYLAAGGAYAAGDPLGIVMSAALAGAPVRLALEGRVQNGAWSFGPSDKFAYLSSSGTVTIAPTAVKLGYVLSSTAIYFIPPSVSGGQTDTITGANGVQNTGGNVNAVISPVYGSAANTVCQGNDARLHSQNTDLGTSSASFEINYTANSARLLTAGLTANRDYTLPDGTTKLVGEAVPASISAQHSFSPAAAAAPFALGANAQGQLVAGLNADMLDGNHASAFAASGHNHAGVYEPSNANIQAHISASAPHAGHESVANKAAANGYASLDASSKVVQDPANATATPTANKIPVADANGKLDGWITPGGGAPAGASYVTTQAEAGLSAETNLGALASGLLKHTVAAGVSTPATAVAGTDYLTPASGAATFAPIAKGVTGGDSHNHTAGGGAAIPLAAGVSGTLPIANGGTGQVTANAALNALLPAQAGNSGKTLLSDGSNTAWTSLIRKNYVINGCGRVQQRTAPTITAAAQYGAADRMLIGVTGATGLSGTVNVFANAGFTSGIGYGAVGASWTNGNFTLKHRIEAQNAKMLNGKTITVSGKIYQDTGGARNFKVNIGKASAADNFATVNDITTNPTSANISIPSAAITAFSWTGTLGASDGSNGIQINVYDADAANTVSNKNYIAGDLQVEIGSVATDFEYEPYQTTLAKCQRYLPAIVGGSYIPAYITSSTTGYVMSLFPVTPRTAPTGITTTVSGNIYTGTSPTALTNLTFTGSTISSFLLTATVASGLTTGQGSMVYTANPILFTGCEL